MGGDGGAFSIKKMINPMGIGDTSMTGKERVATMFMGDAVGLFSTQEGITGKKKVANTSSGQSTAGNDLEVAKQAAAERAALTNDQRRAALARQKTIYTSPLGMTDQASIAKKSLTGQ